MKTQVKSSKPHLVNYYESVENLLARGREKTGNHRTHFGMFTSNPKDYCWLKTVCMPDNVPFSYTHMHNGMDKLHRLLFKTNTKAQTILDVGCGTGGTMKLLAAERPEAQVHGINLNFKQLSLAEQLLEENINTKIHYGDIYDYTFSSKFDLVYFIESAFHMKDKETLMRKIKSSLRPNGDIYIVDIFYPENVWKRQKNKITDEEIFHYLPVSEWNSLLDQNDLEIFDFEDISTQVSRFLKITTPREELKATIIDPIKENEDCNESFDQCVYEIYDGYSRLQKLFAKGLLQYGILKIKMK